MYMCMSQYIRIKDINRMVPWPLNNSLIGQQCYKNGYRANSSFYRYHMYECLMKIQ